MQLLTREFDPMDADPAVLDGIAAVHAAAKVVDEPGAPVPSYDEVVGELRYGWGLGRRRAFVATDADLVVGDLRVVLHDDSNTHLAELELTVHPEHRRRGVGTVLLGVGAEVARGEGRRLLIAEASRLGAGSAFARRHGAHEALVEAGSVCTLAGVDAGVLRDAADDPRSRGYELLRWRAGCPDDLIEAYADLKRAMVDAPVDELDWGPEHWDAAKVTLLERRLAARGIEPWVVVARPIGSRHLVAMTEVLVRRYAPRRGEQGDTVVLAPHRGHGLGLRVKADMVGWLRADRPDVLELETWNAHSNPWMLAVNASLGYRRTQDWSEWQLPTDQLLPSAYEVRSPHQTPP